MLRRGASGVPLPRIAGFLGTVPHSGLGPVSRSLQKVFHTIAGTNGEETFAHWLEAGQQPVAFNILERIGGPGYAISFRNENDEELHAVTFVPAP